MLFIFQLTSTWNDERVNLIMLRKNYEDNVLTTDDVFWTPAYKLTTSFVGSYIDYEKGELSIPAYYAIRVNTVPPSVFDSKEGNRKSPFCHCECKVLCKILNAYKVLFFMIHLFSIPLG